MEPIFIQNIFENLAAGLLVFNPQGEIFMANHAASHILGYPAEFITGKGWADLFMGGENDPFTQVFVDVIWEEQMNRHQTVPYVHPDGALLWLDIVSSYLRVEKGLAGIVIILHDVTEIHALHQQEKMMLEEKNRLQKERSDGLNKLAMAVAHQLRNPTTAIGGFASLMLKKTETGTQNAKYLNKIVSSTMRLEDLVRSVHEYASLPPLSLRMIPVCDLLEPMRERVRRKAVELRRNVDLVSEGASFEVEIDPDLFGKALGEILDNAVEATSGDGKIEVTIALEGEMALIAIQDNGAGISGKDLPFIFDPFFTTKAVGVGMGLCRARQIVAEHRGHLRIDSFAGAGTRALVWIPRTARSNNITKGEQIMEISDEVLGKAMVVKLKGRLDSVSAVSLRDKIKGLVKEGHLQLVIDMAGIEFVDSSGLGSLVACLRSVKNMGGDIRIAALQDRVRIVFELIRLHHIFEVFDSASTAAETYQGTGKGA